MILPVSLGFSRSEFKRDVRHPSALGHAGFGMRMTSPLNRDVFQKTTGGISGASADKVSDLSFGYNFALKQVKGIPCAYCGKDVLSREDLHEMIHLKGSELVDRMNGYFYQAPDKMSDSQRKAFKILKETALEHPDKTAEELLPILFVDSRERLIKKQSKIYDDIEEMAEDLKTRSLSKYVKDIRNQDVVLKQDISLAELSDFLINKQHVAYRKEIIQNIKDIRNSPEAIKNNHAKTWNRIISKVDELPSSTIDEDAYLVKFISKAIKKNINDELIPKDMESSEMFYAQMLYPFLSTAEHIKPFSKKGVSDYSNYLITHSYCNGKRADMPWIDYMFRNPRRFDNVVENLSVVKDKMEEDPKSFRNLGLPDYLQKVSNTLRKEVRRYTQNAFVSKFLDDLSSVQSADMPDVKVKKIKKKRMLSDGVEPFTTARLADLKSLKGRMLGEEIEKYKSFFSSSESMVKLAAIEKVAQWAKENPGKNAEELMPVMYENSKKALVKNRSGIYSRLLRDAFGEDPQLSETIKYLRSKDPLFNENRAVPDKQIEKFLSDTAQDEYKQFLFEATEALIEKTPSSSKNQKWSKIVRKIPNALSPEHKASGYLTKLLLESRNDDYSFDADKFYEILLSN